MSCKFFHAGGEGFELLRKADKVQVHMVGKHPTTFTERNQIMATKHGLNLLGGIRLPILHGSQHAQQRENRFEFQLDEVPVQEYDRVGVSF